MPPINTKWTTQDELNREFRALWGSLDLVVQKLDALTQKVDKLAAELAASKVTNTGG